MILSLLPLLVGLVLIIVFIVFLLLTPSSFIPDDAPRITFKQFKTMYLVCPNSWSINRITYSDYVEYFSGNKSKNIYFVNRLETITARHFIKKVLRKKDYAERLRSQSELAGLFQKDIDAYIQKYTKELKDEISKIEHESNKFKSRFSAS